jgi:predicted DNA-binding ArsR family transcriptional regulator
MIYLDLPSVEDLKKELKRLKMKEVRIHSFYRSETQTQKETVVPITSFYVTLTAKDKKQIIRHEIFVGRDVTMFEDKMKALADTSIKLVKDLTKDLEKSKLTVRAGIYRYSV